MKTKLILLALLLSSQFLNAGNSSVPSVPSVTVNSSTDFLFFKANRFGRSVVMGWAYRNPLMVVFYYVERSTDGVNFTMLTDVMSYGEPWFRFRDTNVPAGGPSFYRIVAFQHDGNIVYSNVEQVRNQGYGCN